MASRTPVGRQPSGPRRTPRRGRVAAATTSAVSDAAAVAARRLGSAASSVQRGKVPFGLTGRALVFLGVVVLLLLSYVTSLRVYFLQQDDLAAARAQIEQRSAKVATLEEELQRWRDPAYVRAQARTRLGWVMPGEVGYRVIDRDGTILSGSAEIEGIGGTRPSGLEPQWWDRLSGSLRAADDPNPVRR